MFGRRKAPLLWSTTLWVKREQVPLTPESTMLNVSTMEVGYPMGATYVSVDIDQLNRVLVEAGYTMEARQVKKV